MARRKKELEEDLEEEETPRARRKHKKESQLHPDTRKWLFVVGFLALALVLLLAGFHQAGPAGESFYKITKTLFGWGYYLLPIVSVLLGLSFLSPDQKKFFGLPAVGGGVFILSGLGLMQIISAESGGVIGKIIGSLEIPFGTAAAVIILLAALAGSVLIILNRPLHIFNWKKNKLDEDEEEEEELNIQLPMELPKEDKKKKPEPEEEEEKELHVKDMDLSLPASGALLSRPIKNYIAPPLDLLVSTVEKPTIGDLRGNANIIKRTLESFGIAVEMGEINVGPTVTRYTLKPAEGMKVSRITSLGQDLALALAAHPIRIEAPIPGKSLVGIEVPNKSAAIVRLGSMLLYPEFAKADPLTFALGRNVQGEPVFVNIAKMPHMLIAGATGSGKSITIQTLILSLLYKNSPDQLKFIMVDPKRVELSIYNGLPHLIAPVVTENKKAIGALRWVIQEMDRRYVLLQEAGSRDIKSYNKSNKDQLPFIVVVIDEMADLMTTFGREVEGSIVRLAQMARATGIHLILSTQRPSVEVITGLIKANITGRIALQVASQIDSRTILDGAGAEKLLGSGDCLLQSAELSKPLRVQGSYITEEELKKVIKFIKENNELPEVNPEILAGGGDPEAAGGGLPLFDQMGGDSDDDELLPEAIEEIRRAGKASASLLQRRLKVGYARAARLIDIMEEKGIVGPGDGAKPREILVDNDPIN
jgi:S-DNA-T family DNA segregation ATPase FtsK/SpoIIIE